MRNPGASAQELNRAAEQLRPYFGAHTSPWCRRALFSTLHHTSKDTERRAFYGSDAPELLNVDPWPERRYSRFYEMELRWCPKCLAQGYHCTAHQLVDLARCPLHNCAIQRGCPHCRIALAFEPPVRAMDLTHPARSCPHCGKDLLQLETCGNWPKRAAFLRRERQVLGAVVRWAQRVASGHFYILSETTGLYYGITQYYCSPQLARAAIGQVFPLPAQLSMAPLPENLRVMSVWLDRRALAAAEVPESERVLLSRSIMTRLSREPIPDGWRNEAGVDEPPRCVGDTREFAYFREWHCYKPIYLHEVLRPCMLRIWGHRFFRDFDVWRRLDRFGFAGTFFWTREPGEPGKTPVAGTTPGCLIEAYFVGHKGAG